MILDDIKTITDANGWNFLYGDKATQNLVDGAISTTPNFFLLPLESSSKYTEFNKGDNQTWTLKFLICKKSVEAELDGGTAAEEGTDYYYNKWLANIKPFYQQILDEFISSFTCLEQYDIKGLNTTEIINSMDWNVDGLYVQMTVEENLIP